MSKRPEHPKIWSKTPFLCHNSGKVTSKWPQATLRPGSWDPQILVFLQVWHMPCHLGHLTIQDRWRPTSLFMPVQRNIKVSRQRAVQAGWGGAELHMPITRSLFPAPNFFPSSPLPAWLIWMTKLLFLSEIVRWRIVLCASYCVVKGKEHGKSCIRILYKKYCVSHIPWHSWVHIYCWKWV